MIRLPRGAEVALNSSINSVLWLLKIRLLIKYFPIVLAWNFSKPHLFVFSLRYEADSNVRINYLSYTINCGGQLILCLYYTKTSS